MKALVVSALSPDLSGVALTDVPAPRPCAGQVLIRVRAAALNYPDLLMTRGDYQLKPPLPFVPGMEVAGEVVADLTTANGPAANGPAADGAAAHGGFTPGDAVVAATRLGGFAELVAVDAGMVRRKPDGLSFVQAAAIGTTYLTAHVALVRSARVCPGEWVVVHGATGGVGWATVDLARALGAQVIATGRCRDKLDLLAREQSVAATVIAPGFRQRVNDLTDGGADVIVDPVGGDVFDESTRCIAFGGRLLVVGFASGRIADLSTNIPLIKGFSVIGVRAGEYGRRFPERGRDDRDTIWRLAAEGRIRPRIDRALPLGAWRDAFTALRDSRMTGKLVLTP